MEQKIEIPKMSIEEIAKHYAHIKPIVKHHGIPTYLRNLTKDELTHISFTWLDDNPSNFTEPVDYSCLSVLADVKMLHAWAYYGFFKPDVGEVISQISKEHLDKVVAFEIMAGAIAYNGMFNKELNDGFHVSIVRLYQAKDSTNEEAPFPKCYPTDDCKVPIGMTEEQFKGLYF